ncbi:unnamed protein product [Schistosoma mattheei]|uniref:Uncharacterized protein n=1 Tax=Schistosoma mattheei TaxID=31246 RepID=A0A183NXM1_9TREM|nr:unnamed protein product [Schistosoma mattheei]
MSRQSYCMRRKLGELRKPSFGRYKCLLTVVYVEGEIRKKRWKWIGHIEESTQLYHRASFHLRFSRPNKRRMTKEHITSRNADRNHMNERKLNRIRKEGPGKSELKNADRLPMFHWE